MKTLTIVLLFFSLVSICYGQPNYFEEKKSVKLRSLGEFIEQPEGNVAFLPGVGKEKYIKGAQNHTVLPESGFFKLPKKGNYFFKVNHTSDTEKTSYLGVTVYLIYPPNLGQKRSWYLYRNEANWKPGEGRTLSRQLDGPKSFPLNAEPYFEAHKQDSLKRCDEILTFTWHAAVETGSPHSWDYKDKWYSAKPPNLAEFIKILGIQEEGYNIAIDAFIIYFTTSSTPKTPLYFWFNADDAVGAYMSIFSPIGPHFDKFYYFKFE